MPQRFLRPGIRTSPRWNAVSHLACRLYISILTQVDDYGRYDGRNSILWSDAFAVWNEQNPSLAVSTQESAAACCELQTPLAGQKEGLLFFYEVNGRRYLQITQWEERARGKSKWPDPKDGQVVDIQQPQESAAERGEMLPLVVESQPIPASIAMSHRHEPSPFHHLNGDAKKSDFEKFWECYPRKVGKKEALKVFDRVKKSMPPIEKVIAAVESQKRTEQWQEDERLIPHPATWLNRGSWDDQVESVVLKPQVNPDVFKASGNGKYTLERAPKREEFSSQESFETILKVYTTWKQKRLVEKEKTK